MQAEFAVPRGGKCLPSCAVFKHSHESRKTFWFFRQHARGLFIPFVILRAAAILSRDPSSDLKHKYVTTEMWRGCTRCQCVEPWCQIPSCALTPSPPLPGWPRQLPRLGRRARPQGEETMGRCTKVQRLKIKRKTFDSCKLCNCI